MTAEADIVVRVLGQDEAHVLNDVAPDVFDGPIDARWTAQFFSDARHHLAVALDAGQVVGFASAVRYVHPDKPPEVFVNEVGVAATHRRRGLGRRLVERLFDHARTSGCETAWVLTDASNEAARRLYASVGGEESESRIFVVSLKASSGS
ncbi:GNAT family N-acetyltransferase [Deinococcus yavapaiensis]|uniref:Acetyltransferase (GNAT) family protein n=1 Tax=Deinococcus yavapaiensis KR-236 TaxID=694435 RepID=A0A318SCP8_9DEIO|nr:GNAT family N-acetyltransferase [Deinococcus yavapaiensis]PYE54138.1 acetyltransferase (GNAT) family protein [Deinococcus yavapaiensis KR-236]